MTKTQISDQKVAREIARRNRVFLAATKAEKRVLIAKDVVKQLKAGKFKAHTGSFVHWDTIAELKTLGNAKGKTSVQALLLTESPLKCDCCALGSMMLSCTMFKNRVSVEDTSALEGVGEVIDGYGEYKDPNGFTKLFSKEQFHMVENAFEEGMGYFANMLDEELKVKCTKFGSKYKNDNTRLLAIMSNIIKNKGTFKP